MKFSRLGSKHTPPRDDAWCACHVYSSPACRFLVPSPVVCVSVVSLGRVFRAEPRKFHFLSVLLYVASSQISRISILSGQPTDQPRRIRTIKRNDTPPIPRITHQTTVETQNVERVQSDLSRCLSRARVPKPSSAPNTRAPSVINHHPISSIASTIASTIASSHTTSAR